jgi:hypothetical protein
MNVIQLSERHELVAWLGDSDWPTPFVNEFVTRVQERQLCGEFLEDDDLIEILEDLQREFGRTSE